jgi:hypothetical protein
MANISTVAPYASAECRADIVALRRLFVASLEARQRQADREVAAIIARSGHPMPEALDRRADR